MEEFIIKPASLLLLLALNACSGAKKAARESHVRTENHAQTRAVQAHSSHERQNETERTSDAWNERLRQAFEAASGEQLQVEMKLYDTGKAADSLTGKAPLLAEVSVRRERQAKTQQSSQGVRQGESARETMRENERTDSLYSQWNERGESRSDTRTQESSKSVRRTPGWVYVLLAGGLTALTLFVRRTFKGRL